MNRSLLIELAGVRWWIVLVFFAAGVRVTSFAQTDEIQVYDAAIADPGKVNLMIHSNFTPDGLKAPAAH